MRVKCCIKNCYSNSENEHISFHRFPFNDNTFKKWILAIRANVDKSFYPSKREMICSKHFLDSNKYESKRRIRLFPDAVPSYFPISDVMRLTKPCSVNLSQVKQITSSKREIIHSNHFLDSNRIRDFHDAVASIFPINEVMRLTKPCSVRLRKRITLRETNMYREFEDSTNLSDDELTDSASESDDCSGVYCRKWRKPIGFNHFKSEDYSASEVDVPVQVCLTVKDEPLSDPDESILGI